MNIIVRFAALSLVTATVAFAQSPRQVGAWSVYTSSGVGSGKNVVMLQTTTSGQHLDGQANSAPAKLDVICKNDRLIAIAVERGSKIDKHLLSDSQAVPTTKVIFVAAGRMGLSENWAVADGGLTLSPYSELFQAKLNRTWVKRISGTEQMVLQLGRDESGEPVALTFDTADLSAALQSAGCNE